MSTVSVTCRPGTAEECDRFARQWATALDAETRPVEAFGPFVQLGPKRGHGVRHRLIQQGLRLATADLASSSSFAIADAEGVALGWLAFDLPTEQHPLTLHFAHVDSLVRRRGIGLMLLREALAFRDKRAPRYTCITLGGAALLRAVAALPAETEAHATGNGVVEARGL